MDGTFPVFLRNGGNDLFTASVLGVGADVAGGIAPENGLDVQHGADQCAGTADPSGALQEIQIVHREELQHFRCFCIQRVRGLRNGFARGTEIGAPTGEKACAEAGAEGVHNADDPAGKFRHQFFRGKPCCLNGTADAGGHTDIDHVVSCLQLRCEVGQKQVGIEQGGIHLRTLPEHIIKLVEIKAVHVSVVGTGDTVQVVGAGKNSDVQLLQLFAGQVGRAVNKDGKSHGKPPEILPSSETGRRKKMMKSS